MFLLRRLLRRPAGRPAVRSSAVALTAAAVLTACSGSVLVAPSGDVEIGVAVPAPPPSPPPADDLDRTGLQATLDAVGAAFLAKDPEALRPWLHDPESAFGRRWLERARNLEQVPLETYALELDRSLPDLATDRVRSRYDQPAVVVYVVERHAIAGFDSEGPVAEDLFLTMVRAADRWTVAEDTDGELLGLVSADHLWDHGPVVATGDETFLALHHPETAGSVPTLLAEARAALQQVHERWRLPWDGRVPLVVPRDQDELAELLHVTFDLSDFIAFATATPDGELGDYRLTGPRVVVNTERFLERGPEVRRSIFAHELVHVATRPHAGPAVPAWLEEGLAQRLGEQRSTTGTDLLTALVRRGFDGQLPEEAQFTNGGRERIFLSYQLAWSFADFLADRYGEDRLAEFYRELGRGSVGEPGLESHHLDRAARAVYGESVAALQAAWAAALRG